jgi:MFS family permease
VPQARHRRRNAGAQRTDRTETGFRAVLQVREFRVLWLANLQSAAGDQLARVALSVLVYNHTGSGFLTAGAYALTFLPALLGSLLLGWLADRLPRRGVIVAGDAARAVLLAAMALPMLPLWALIVLLVVVVIVGTPWKAAEAAMVSEILAGERYVLGTGLRAASSQASQLIGFGIGGLAVAAIGAHAALAVDAATFAVSAGLIRIAVTARPAPEPESTESTWQTWSAGIRVAFGSTRLRLLLGLIWLGGLVVVPEGLAAPYADAIGGGPDTVGLLLAAGPAGLLIATVLFTRLLHASVRSRAIGPMAMLSASPLLLLYDEPGLALALPLLALSGLAAAYQSQAMPEFVLAIPTAKRGQAIAFASAGLLVGQGVGLLLGGAVAEFWSVGPAIALAGALGTVGAAVLGAARAGHTYTRAQGQDSMPDPEPTESARAG